MIPLSSASPPIRLATILILLLALIVTGTAALAETTDTGGTGYDELANLLEDDASRERLVQELRRLASGEDTRPSGTETATPAEEESVSLPQRIADFTQGVAEGTVSELTAATHALRELDMTGNGALASLAAASLDLAVVIVVTIILFLILRRLAAPLFRRASEWAAQPGSAPQLIRRTIAVVAGAIVDVLVVLLAWVGGYLCTLFLVGDTGEMETRHSLFLNAFLLIEVFKAAIRMLFSSRYESLRLLPMAGEEAAYWNAWLARLAGFIGYGLLVAVPLVDLYVGTPIGRAVALLIMLVAFTYALVIILQNRSRVRQRLEDTANASTFAFTRFLTSLLARFWHLIAIAYFAALAVVTVTRPEDALPFMAQATGQTVLAVLAGAFFAVVLSQIISRQVHIPEETRQRFPLLEARLNAYIPAALKIMRLVILLLVLAVIADAWNLFDLGTWMVSEAGARFIGTAVSVLLIVFLATLFWVAVASWIEHRLNPETGGGEPGPREKTLLTIFRNAIAVTLIIMTSMIVLAELGINIGPLIAGAGVVGLAIGFGAQKLVQDIITGVFIQLENAINAGDVVTAGGITVVAEKLTIRSLGIRDLSGTYHIVPFSSVDSVSNYMRDFAYHVGEYGVAYREDTDEVIVRLREAFDELKAHEEHAPMIIDDLEVHGVTALADSSVNVRIRIKTLPGAQWAIGREYNRLVKRHFDAAGIEIPFPHMTLYFGEGKEGAAPPAHISMVHRKARAEDTGDDSPQRLDRDRARANPKYKGDFDDEGD